MLSVENLNVYYGAIHALHDISFHVDTGEIVTLIGANGAGKTSILQSISALIPRRSGAITFDGKDLSHIPAHRLISMGLTQVPEGRRVFATMTVMENLEMGAYTRRSRTETQQDLDMVFAHFPRLKERMKQYAGTLSGGEQQMLAMGRALMSHPKLLMMDEPSMGLSPILVQEIFSTTVRPRNRWRESRCHTSSQTCSNSPSSTSRSAVSVPKVISAPRDLRMRFGTTGRGSIPRA